jgi:hypothetical protein
MLKDRLKYLSPLNDPEYDCDKRNNQKSMNQVSRAERKKSDCPCDHKDDRDDIKKTSHGFVF